MNIHQAETGHLTIEMDNYAEAVDFAADLVIAMESPGTDVDSPLLTEDGISTLTIRVAG